ncbi:MAG TPA: hypothetical protein VGH00_07100 [Chthoniobacterales bacterium]
MADLPLARALLGHIDIDKSGTIVSRVVAPILAQRGGPRRFTMRA